ncbi:hypothetical protein VCRA2113O415_40172 [Vibrio crassostreae]|nr:hypothetical protein VCRA2110O182_40318 [Vibrio crassostreae]CAK2350641.1 hypothetical protein VCRA211O406_30021 [Vibrio crassostreae]CAK2511521.1 hypothetical protein VCRA2113O415_40172 [Vibrio crassostreae]CAK2657646.1 hypothetical protein VCRA2113O420_200049 [Vibrio crassostreae]CAK3264434.1 hypothetical protein VCRA2121O436_200035 [Vibrio crassostreae]
MVKKSFLNPHHMTDYLIYHWLHINFVINLTLHTQQIYCVIPRPLEKET